MSSPRDPDFLSGSEALCEAIMRLHGDLLADELGRIARSMLNSPAGQFVQDSGGVATFTPGRRARVR